MKEEYQKALSTQIMLDIRMNDGQIVKDNLKEIQQPKYSYSSSQVNIEQPLKKEILDFAKSFIDKADLAEDGYEETPHVTIRYGIEDMYPDSLIKAVQLVRPIKLILSKTSIFNTSPDFDVVKIDVLSKDLRELNKLIRIGVLGKDTYRSYSPHLTLAYVKKGMGEKYIGNTTFEGKQLTFNRIIFSNPKNEQTIIYLNETDIEDNA